MRKLTALCCLLAATLSAAQAQISVNGRYIEYVDTYAPMAVAEMQNTRIPASITLAQGLLESGGGGSALARESNNHFGIKCGSSWTGRTHHQEDDDYDRGRLTQSCFRAYTDAAESYSDHSTFLMGSQRYAGLFQLDPADYRSWAHGLREAGYATSPTYAKQLIEIIELYELQRYDQGIAGLPLADRTLTEGAKKRSSGSFGRPVLSGAKLPKSRRNSDVAASGSSSSGTARREETASNGRAPGRRVGAGADSRSTVTAPAEPKALGIQSINDVEFLLARAGESVNDVAKRGQVGAKDLLRYNEGLKEISDRLEAGQRVYLQPKRLNYRGHEKSHRVGASESIQTIADTYGLTTEGLKRRNRIAEDQEPVKGETLVIRGNRTRGDEPKVMDAKKRYAEIAQLQAAASPLAPVDAGQDLAESPDRELAPEVAETRVLAPEPNHEPNHDPSAVPTSTQISKPSSRPSTQPSTSSTAGTSIRTSPDLRPSAPRREVPTVIVLPPVDAGISASSSTKPEVVRDKPSTTKVRTTPTERPLPTASASSEESAAPTHPRIVVVRQGDTLFKISKATGVSVEEIKALNGMENNTIRVGQRLLVAR